MARFRCHPDLSHNLRQHAWLAGFIDGEGSLGIAVNRRVGNYWPTLAITQRDDDAALMRQIAEALGGHMTTKHTPSMTFDTKPYVRIEVASKPSLMGAVAYLDVHGLRTKKAREYVVWREAVMAYVEHGGRSPVLPAAKQQLEALRDYALTNQP
jgi:hypothetical protein